MLKTIDKKVFIDCEDLDNNTSTFNFATNKLKIGKINLSPQLIKRIAFLLAYDLKSYANTGNILSNLTANEVYKYL